MVDRCGCFESGRPPLAERDALAKKERKKEGEEGRDSFKAAFLAAGSRAFSVVFGRRRTVAGCDNVGWRRNSKIALSSLFNEQQWLLCRGVANSMPPWNGAERKERRRKIRKRGLGGRRRWDRSFPIASSTRMREHRRLIPGCRIRESVSPAPSDRFGQCAKTGLQPSARECTLSLAGPLIIYPYWTQFTLKLTGSRLVSPAKLTSKLTIYSRSIPLSSLSLSLLFPVRRNITFSSESIVILDSTTTISRRQTKDARSKGRVLKRV